MNERIWQQAPPEEDAIESGCRRKHGAMGEVPTPLVGAVVDSKGARREENEEATYTRL